MGRVLGDSNVGDVCLEHYRWKQGSVPYAYEADFLNEKFQRHRGSTHTIRLHPS